MEGTQEEGAGGGGGGGGTEANRPSVSSGARKSRTARGDSNVMRRIQKCLDESNFYEALQLIKMLTNRHLSQRHYDQAESTLLHGMKALLTHQQTAAASELGQQLIKLYVDTHKKPTDAIIETIIRLFHSYGPDANDGRVGFIKAAIRWTINEGTGKIGDPQLHEALADFYTSQGEYGSAQQHYVRSNSVHKFSAMLVEYAKGGPAEEADLCIVRAVLMYLCLQKQTEAKQLLQTFSERNPSLNMKPTPLINFANLLLDSFTRTNAKHLFMVLRKHYSVALSRDPELLQYTDQVGSVYYGLQPRTNAGPFGLFNDFLKAFLSPDPEGRPSS